MEEPTLSIYFVQRLPTDKTDKNMQLAFKTCKKASLNPEWVLGEDIRDLQMKSNMVYVLRNFEGEIFEYLASKECLVCGPKCIHTCVSEKLPIPENQSPVFTTAMRGLVVTATKLTPSKKEEVKKLVRFMGGIYSDNLSMAVTHLVGNDCRSEKCEKAGELKIPVMMASWVEAVWEASLKKDVCATDRTFDKHRLPVFKGMEISCSNLAQKIKKELQQLIETNGGVYNTGLVQYSTHRLVVGRADGDKYKHAQMWNIPCVKPDWVHASVERGVALGPKDFSVLDRPKCSTPTSELPSFMSNSEISVIPGADVTRSEINDTVASAVSIASLPAQLPSKPQEHPGSDYKKFFDRLNVSDAYAAGLFLDGCKIYLSGFTNQELEKLKKILNSGGATIFRQITDRITHVVAGEFVTADAKAIAQLQPRPHVVTTQWILESLKEKNPANVEPYLCLKNDEKAAPPPPSPLSHKGLELLKSKQVPPPDMSVSDRPISRKLFVKTQHKAKAEVQEQEKTLCTNDPPEIQELPKLQETRKSQDETRPQEISKPKISETNRLQDQSQLSEGDTFEPTNFFEGLVFEVSVPEPEETIKVIETAGGKVVSSDFHGVADYAIVTLDETQSRFSAPEIVTTLWIEDCFEQNSVVKVDYYHQPLNFKEGCRPLEDTAVCISGFYRKERVFISYVAAMLGSNVQESFSRNNHPEKGIMKSTHLVCNEPNGSKYNAAVKWGIPAVNSKWLLSCALSGKLEPADQYLLSMSKTDSLTTPVRNKSEPTTSAATPVSSRTGTSERVTPIPATAAKATTPVNGAAAKAATPMPGMAATPPLAAPDPRGQTPNTPDIFAVPANKPGESGEKLTILKRKLATSGMRNSQSVISLDDDDDEDFNFEEGLALKKRLSDKGLETKMVTPTVRKLSIDSAGPSPFHMDTPDTPYGQVFCDGPPSPNTRKKWKRYIDKFPDMFEGSPTVKDRRLSTPLAVIKKQLLVKFGRAEIEGINPDGSLLPNGPYGEWAQNNSLDSSGVDAQQPALAQKLSFDNSLDGILSGVALNGDEVFGEGSSSKSKDINDAIGNNKHEGVENKKSKEVTDLKCKLPTYRRSEPPVSEDCEEDPSDSVEETKQNTAAGTEVEPEPQEQEGQQKSRNNEEVFWDHEKPSFLRGVMGSESKTEGSKKKTPEIKEKEINIAADVTLDRDITRNFETEDMFVIKTPKLNKQMIFTFSNISKNTKEKYEGIITSLAGEVSDSRGYDGRVTHLVIDRPARSEKLLCCMASGKWILHLSYLDQCYESRKFIPEEDYEWGNPTDGSKVPELAKGSQEWFLAKAAYRWRRKRSDLGPNAGPYRGIRAVLLTPPTKTPQYTNLLVAGGATILDKEKIMEATHCFMNEGKAEVPVGFAELARRNIHCLQPVFLGELLVKNPCDPANYWVDGYRRVVSVKRR